MKRYTSVLALAARSTIWKGLGLLAASVAVQCLLFARFLSREMSIDTVNRQLILPAVDGRQMLSVNETTIFSLSGVSAVALVTLVLLLLLLVGVGWRRGSRVDYIIDRLSVPGRTVDLLWAAHHLGWLVLFWAVELVTALALMMWYQTYLYAVPGLPLFVDAHTNGLLRALMPLEDPLRWAANITTLVALALMAADLSSRGRRHMPVATGIFLCGMILLPALTRSGMGSIGSDVASLALSAIGVWRALDDLWGGERNER